jgi:uncharacterized repeat protein (TIGR03803 family)
MRKIHPARFAAVVVVGALSAGNAAAKVFDPVHSFIARPDGTWPQGGVTPLGGFLYGMTEYGGAADQGTIYRIDPLTNAETVVHDFVGSSSRQDDGDLPFGELVAVDGVLYGTTSHGGTFNRGTVFRFDPATGFESLVHSFGASGDGSHPQAGLIHARGRLFGTTVSGGVFEHGTVYAVDIATGDESVLHSFAGADAGDGALPFAPLAFGNGLLYGTTASGGASNTGTAFSVDPRTGSEVVLHDFTGPLNLADPEAGLTFHDGILYGTTLKGGLPKCDGGSGCGTVFRIDTATGEESDLYAFKSGRDGSGPDSRLLYNDGRLIGTTLGGGPGGGYGSVFAVDVATGTKVTLYSFPDEATGSSPHTLVAYGDKLYGTTTQGGSGGQGTVFGLSR